MGLPERICGHFLFITSSPADKLALFERVLAGRDENDGNVVVFVPGSSAGSVERLLDLCEVPGRRRKVVPFDAEPEGDSPAWASFCARVDQTVRTVSENRPEQGITILIDLNAAFSLCDATSEMMSMVYHLSREHVAHGVTAACFISQDSLPQDMPDDFFDIHSIWAFGRNSGGEESAALDQEAERLALTFPEFRQRFLASARNGRGATAPLLPRFLEDFRHGILIVDRNYVIRFCSTKAGKLLGRNTRDLADRPINICVDGVDLVTIKHECAKLTPGTQAAAPFIASFRISPGVYEPRAVSVDPLRSGHQTVGYIMSISRVEAVRGPRAVYEQLKEEKAAADQERDAADDDSELTHDETVSSDLHGTLITRREHEVILLILRGMTNREISEHLRIAEVTVKKHLTSVYRKLRITSRRELISSFTRPGNEP